MAPPASRQRGEQTETADDVRFWGGRGSDPELHDLSGSGYPTLLQHGTPGFRGREGYYGEVPQHYPASFRGRVPVDAPPGDCAPARWLPHGSQDLLRAYLDCYRTVQQ